MNIGIIGGGYVGIYTALKIFKINKNWNISVLDTDEEKIKKFNSGDSPIDDYYMNIFMQKNFYKLNNIHYDKPDDDWSKYQIVIIALPTNPIEGEDSRLNTSWIFDLSKRIKKQNKEISIILRSTINIDDYKKIEEIGLSYWPEFLSQGVETEKNINQKNNVAYIAKDEKNTLFFDSVFLGKKLIKVNSKESIFIKIMHNTLDAYLISLTNLFANISEENNISFSAIASIVELLLQKRPKVKNPGIGYGGSCYPKDSYSLINITNRESNKKLIQTFEDFNNDQSKIFLEKVDLISRAKNIILLGSSYKGGTNDITKTPTLALRKFLLEEGISYKIWEPMINSKWCLEGEKISKDINLDISNSDLIIVASDWSEFNELLINYEENVIDLKSFIIDNGKMNLYRIGEKKKI